MTRSTTASRSTTSRAVAVLILGAALSSGVLAAPTRSPMTPSSIGARDLQSQSPSDGLGTLSEGELPTLQHGVPRQSGDSGLTPFDDSENGEDGADVNPDVSEISVSSEQRVDLLKRSGCLPICWTTSTHEDDTPLLSGEKTGGVPDLELPGLNAKEREKKQFLNDKAEEIQSWLHGLEVEHQRLASDPASEWAASEQMTTLIFRHGASLNRLFSITYGRKKPQYVPALHTQIIALWKEFQSFVRAQMEHQYHFLEYLKSDWELACRNDAHSSGGHARRKVFDDHRNFSTFIYEFTHAALQFQVISPNDFKPYEEMFAEWHAYYGFPNPLQNRN
ncbi:hypothetical protein FB446DRAFT_361958 [Lentinula raphanica]|nr:hypothetical protein FB446DRAFT_361958 [Lentinula raphanica]